MYQCEYEGGVAGRLAPVHGSGDRRRRKARPQQSGPGLPRARCAIQLLPDTSSLIVRSNDLPEAETLIREVGVGLVEAMGPGVSRYVQLLPDTRPF